MSKELKEMMRTKSHQIDSSYLKMKKSNRNSGAEKYSTWVKKFVRGLNSRLQLAEESVNWTLCNYQI